MNDEPMNLRRITLAVPTPPTTLAALTLALLLLGCSAEDPVVAGSAGTSATAGSATAGFATGGSATAGAATGGSATAGAAAAGAATGGSATAGSATGGSATAGSATGGSATGGAGAGGSATGAGGATASFATLKNIIQMSCFGGLCHDLPEHPLKLKLDDQLYTTLTTHQTKTCGPLLKPGSPQESALVKLLKGPCGETARMPLDKCYEDGDEACVTPANIALIEQWITNGAPQ